jgi:hypothetical protein
VTKNWAKFNKTWDFPTKLTKLILVIVIVSERRNWPLSYYNVAVREGVTNYKEVPTNEFQFVTP